MIRAVALIIERQGRLLLQLRDDKPGVLHPGCWGTFGGHIDEGESPEMAVRREAREELGYEIDELISLGEVIHDGFHEYAFLVRDDGFVLKDIREGRGAAFFLPEEIASLRCSKGVPLIIQRYLEVVSTDQPNA